MSAVKEKEIKITYQIAAIIRNVRHTSSNGYIPMGEIDGLINTALSSII